MYLRYPYEQDNDLTTNIGTLMCAVQFVAPIRDAALSALVRLREIAWDVSKGENRKFAALHLRLELSDSVSMRAGRREPSNDNVRNFVSRVLVPRLRRMRIHVLLVSSGRLHPKVWKNLVDSGHARGILVVSKESMLNKPVEESSESTERQRDERSIKATPLDGAAVDLMIMEKADAVFLTTTSSFSAAVYAKRCGGSVLLGRSITWNITREQLRLPNNEASERIPGRIYDSRQSGCTLIGNVFLYDTYGDGSFTDVVEMPCGYQFGMYIKAPPAMVHRPPPSLDVLAFRFFAKSPLYTEPWRNEGMKDL